MDVSIASHGKLSPDKGLLVLGEKNSGKTSLTCRLNQKALSHESHGLEYHFIDIKDEERDGKNLFLLSSLVYLCVHSSS